MRVRAKQSVIGVALTSIWDRRIEDTKMRAISLGP